MLNELVKKFSSSNEKVQTYVRDIQTHIQTSLDRELSLYAVHGFCTDGGTSGAMIIHAIPEASIVPLDYDVLKNSSGRSILSDLPWKGIVDLEPFNYHPLKFYVDHHVSTQGKPINAQKIRFDSDGDSGAWQLLESNFLGELPLKLVELAVMTRTTDTAGYQTEPPVTLYKDLSEITISTTDGKQGQIENESRIWLLDDVWGTVTSLKDHLNLMSALAKDGFLAINSYLPIINERRNKRMEAITIANELSITSDLVIFSFAEDSLDKFSLLRRLQTRGAKVVISMSKTNNGVKISFRRNRSISTEDKQKLNLNELAKSFNGGGHEAASGGFATNMVGAVDQISAWALKLGYSTEYHELS